MALLSKYIAWDLSGYDVDGPVPVVPQDRGAPTRSALLSDTARAEGLTIRQLYQRIAGGRGHYQIVGSPQDVVDMMEDDGASAAGVRSNSALWPVTRRCGQARGVGVLDAMLQIRLFGKLKLAICVRSRAQRVDGLSSLRNPSPCGSTLIGA